MLIGVKFYSAFKSHYLSLCMAYMKTAGEEGKIRMYFCRLVDMWICKHDYILNP